MLEWTQTGTNREKGNTLLTTQLQEQKFPPSDLHLLAQRREASHLSNGRRVPPEKAGRGQEPGTLPLGAPQPRAAQEMRHVKVGQQRPQAGLGHAVQVVPQRQMRAGLLESW